MSTKAGKRPLRSLTAHEKLDAIRRVHDGESKASVARDIGVPESTLRGWCKNEDKISYLSRQSSPETDESLEHKDKRQKVDESVMQPFNLSLKTTAAATTNAYSPNSEQRYTMDFMKNDIVHDVSKTAKPETPKSATSHMSERERNRAELARLSVELGLNRPEMFLPSLNTTTNTLADLTANIGILAQWNNLLMQQQQQQQKTQQISKKITAPADTSTNLVSSSGGGGCINGGGLLTTVDNNEKHNNALKPPKEKQSVNDYVSYWLKTQQALFGLSQTQPSSTIQNSGNGLTATSTANHVTSNSLNSSTLNGVTPDQSSWFWKWYKQFAYNQQQPVADKPILYQQLTKDQQNAENLSTSDDKPKNNTNNKARSVLDSLLFNNNNNVAVNNKKDGKEDDVETVSQSEALEHGEKFLKWLEACSDPSVTAMQIMQFRSLLNNVKTGADRKNGDIQNKTKVKRK